MNAKEMTHCATCFILVLLILSLTSCSSHNLGTDLAIIVSDRHVIQAGASDGMYNQTPAVVEAADGDYVLTYRKGPNHVNSPQVILRRSSDKGITWTPEVVQWDTSTPDPALARTPGGDLLIEFGKLNPQSVSGAAYGRSLDNGLMWSSFTFFDNPVSNTSFVGELYINDGSLMYAPAYGPHGDGTDDATLWSSSDDGYTWSKRSTIRGASDHGINETAVARVGPNNLLAISRDDAGGATYAHLSPDMGLTWGTELSYTSQVGVLQAPQLLQIRDALLLFGRNPAANQLVVYGSNDSGVTFTDKTVLETYTGLSIDGGYCWPIMRADGNVFVVYYADSLGLREPDIKSLVLHWK